MKWIVTVLVVGALAALYLTGSLDKMLYPLGLNHGDCDREPSGEIVCGEELADYEKEQDEAEKAAGEAQDRKQEAIGEARDAAKDARSEIGASVDKQQDQNQQALDSLDKATESYDKEVEQQEEAYDDVEAALDQAEKNAAEREKQLEKR